MYITAMTIILPWWVLTGLRPLLGIWIVFYSSALEDPNQFGMKQMS